MISFDATFDKNQTRRGGLTLVEMVISVILVGAATVAGLNTLAASKMSQSRIDLSARGQLLAQQLMTEILLQDYADASGSIDSFGTTVAEQTPGDRSRFDDVDDYDGWSAKPPEAKDGNPYAQLHKWERSVEVVWVNASDLTQSVGSHLGAKRITVTVTKNGSETAKLVALKTIGLPPQEACCFADQTCAALRIEDCVAGGGTAMGSDTNCATLDCPMVYQGWTVGDTGTILHSTDGGANWNSQTSGTAESLRTVYFPNPLVGYAAGLSGTILKTIDGGSAWIAQSSGSANILWHLDFLDADIGYMVGQFGYISKTINGGASWIVQASGTAEHIRNVDFLDASTGYVVGKIGTVLKTIDGGLNWTPQASGTALSLHAVAFANASTGWFVGRDGVIGNTVNGGTNWTPQVSGTAEFLQGVTALSPTTAIICGRAGTILKTVDGGANWQPQTSGTTVDLWHVNFVDSSTGYIVGQTGTILNTNDGGTTWSSQDSGTTEYLRGVHFVEAVCGDANCDPGETCTCVPDCGVPDGFETPNVTCDDGTDNDCDGPIDCADINCAADPACCQALGTACTQDWECCSGTCGGTGTCD